MTDSTNHSSDFLDAAPGVVVVIPFYNGSQFIERALCSVYAQSMPAAEVIVVNDGSRPEERDFLNTLCERYPFSVIDKENGGQGSARNAGAAASSAPYICFLDQDDFYLTHHIRTLVQAIPHDEPRFGFVYADLIEADGEGNVVASSAIQGRCAHPKTSVFEMLRADMYILPSAALISRAAFEAVDGFDTQFVGFEDDDLFLRIFHKGYTNHYVDQAVTVWCIHTDSTSFGMRMIRSRFNYFKKMAAMFPDEPWRNRYYLRDCLMPRFGRYFVDHVIEATKTGHASLFEMRAILSEYAAIVQASPNAGSKMRLRAIMALVRYSPPALIRTIGAFTRLPGVRALRRALG
ncbi:MAG: glycosyltransferase family 2 protein [Burkholderiaceae bacterium]|jgi:glycosyltransferase involved in cell wall biosynthesis|nr:glycosyltransferase family 2 protein [Burkholderiaceae bacterium]